MNSNPKLKLQCASLGLAGLLAAGAALAATHHYPKEGKFAYTSCWSGTIKAVGMSKAHSVWSYEFMGETIADKPGSIFDHDTFQCEGAGFTLGKAVNSRLACVAVDPDGDRNMTSYTLGKDGKYHGKELGGTGKYEGMERRAQLQHLGPFPTIKKGTFQDCNHVVGTYKLK